MICVYNSQLRSDVNTAVKVSTAMFCFVMPCGQAHTSPQHRKPSWTLVASATLSVLHTEICGWHSSSVDLKTAKIVHIFKLYPRICVKDSSRSAYFNYKIKCSGIFPCWRTIHWITRSIVCRPVKCNIFRNPSRVGLCQEYGCTVINDNYINHHLQGLGLIACSDLPVRRIDLIGRRLLSLL
jgi:hypothetical protein